MRRFHNLIWITTALLMACAAAGSSTALATSADPDTSWNGDGSAVLGPAESQDDNMGIAGSFLDSRSRLIVVVDSDRRRRVIRFTRKGALDTSFGGDGSVSLPMTTATGGMPLPGGQLLISGVVRLGFNNSPPRLVRLNADGSLDDSFDGEGIKTYDVQIEFMKPWIEAMQQLPNGNIVALLASDPGAGLMTIAPDGTLLSQPWEAGGQLSAFDLALDASGNAVVGGIGAGHSGQFDRVLPDGTPDPSFDADGTVNHSLAPYSTNVQAIMVAADGTISFAGEARTQKNDWGPAQGVSRGLVGRLLPDGSLDPAFAGGAGSRMISILSGDDWFSSIAPGQDGGLIVAGATYDGQDRGTDGALVYLNANGTLNQQFGSGGVVLAPLKGVMLSQVHVEPDGRIIVVGTLEGNQTRRVFTARYRGDAADLSGDAWAASSLDRRNGRRYFTTRAVAHNAGPRPGRTLRVAISVPSGARFAAAAEPSVGSCASNASRVGDRKVLYCTAPTMGSRRRMTVKLRLSVPARWDSTDIRVRTSSRTPDNVRSNNARSRTLNF